MSISNLYRKLFLTAEWRIAYRRNKNHWPFRYEIPFIPISNSKNQWYADPLLFNYKDRSYLFCEAFDRSSNIGQLAVSCFENEKWSVPKVIIKNDYHMSYPFVFTCGDDVFMIPESAECGSLELYKCTRFPYDWTKECNLLSDTQLADPTVFSKDGNLYMYAYSEDNHHYKGFLYKVDLKEHKCILLSTKIYDANDARPAGHFFITDGKVIRPAQDSRSMYGLSILWREMTITGNTFEDCIIDQLENAKVKVGDRTGVDRIHTFSYDLNYEFIDYCTFRFDFFKRLRILKRKMDIKRRSKK